MAFCSSAADVDEQRRRLFAAMLRQFDLAGALDQSADPACGTSSDRNQSEEHEREPEIGMLRGEQGAGDKGADTDCTANEMRDQPASGQSPKPFIGDKHVRPAPLFPCSLIRAERYA
jgi:hypothetical protein